MKRSLPATDGWCGILARGSNPNPRCYKSQSQGEGVLLFLLGAPSIGSVFLLGQASSLSRHSFSWVQDADGEADLWRRDGGSCSLGIPTWSK
jgi:hypothetical protein